VDLIVGIDCNPIGLLGALLTDTAKVFDWAVYRDRLPGLCGCWQALFSAVPDRGSKLSLATTVNALKQAE
jgi:hypothetical protein